MGVVSEHEKFVGNSTIDGIEHDYYESNSCSGEYVFRQGAEAREKPEDKGRSLVSLVNATEQNVAFAEVEFVLRDPAFVYDVGRGITYRRDLALEFEDVEGNAALKLTWDQAAKRCEELIHDGHDDWRLPSRQELSNIAYTETMYDEGLSAGAFHHTARSNTVGESDYWTSNVIIDSEPTAAYAVESGGILLYKRLTLESQFVRCVRSSTNMCEITD